MIKVFGKSKEKTTDAPMGSAEYGKFIRAAYMDTVSRNFKWWFRWEFV